MSWLSHTLAHTHTPSGLILLNLSPMVLNGHPFSANANAVRQHLSIEAPHTSLIHATCDKVQISAGEWTHNGGPGVDGSAHTCTNAAT